jgi:1-acyl-sn-glycerol-3-phosphate acyltransferase
MLPIRALAAISGLTGTGMGEAYQLARGCVHAALWRRVVRQERPQPVRQGRLISLGLILGGAWGTMGGEAATPMSIRDELTRGWQWIRLGIVVFGHHFVKLVGNLIDREEGVIEQRVGKRMSQRMLEVLKLDASASGLDHVRGLQNYAVVANHFSYLDWVLLLGHFPNGLCFVAKKEATWMPVFGSYLRNHGILIDRKRGMGARKAIRQGAKESRWPILLFPEGTRSPDGEIQPFRRGGLAVLAEEGLTLVPVTLLGTYEALSKEGRAIRYGKKIELVIGEPVDPKVVGEKESLEIVERRIRQVFEERREEFR